MCQLALYHTNRSKTSDLHLTSVIYSWWLSFKVSNWFTNICRVSVEDIPSCDVKSWHSTFNTKCAFPPLPIWSLQLQCNKLWSSHVSVGGGSLVFPRHIAKTDFLTPQTDVSRLKLPQSGRVSQRPQGTVWPGSHINDHDFLVRYQLPIGQLCPKYTLITFNRLISFVIEQNTLFSLRSGNWIHHTVSNNFFYSVTYFLWDIFMNINPCIAWLNLSEIHKGL